MKIILTIIICIVLSLMISNAYAIKTYVDTINGFEIDYPSTWYSYSTGGSDELFKIKASNRIREEGDGSLAVFKMDNRSTENSLSVLDEFVNIARENCESQDRDECDKFNLISKEIIPINQKQSYYFSYTSLINGIKTTQWIGIIPNDNEAWVVAAKSVKPTKWSDEIEESIKSIRIIPTNLPKVIQTTQQNQTQIDPPSLDLNPGPSEQSTQKIPDWVKNIALWYGQGQISEDEFVTALQYLVKEGILIFPSS